MDVTNMEFGQAAKHLNENISCAKWAKIFVQNLENKGTNCAWKFNVADLAANMAKRSSDVATWHAHYGLWPGNALALFAAHSRWVHLSTNTLAFYNVIPRL
jgi:hypothetical protein